MPHAADARGIQAPPGVEIAWCVTEDADDQLATVREWLTAYGPPATDDARTTIVLDGSEDPYWEITDPETTPTDAPALSAWIAGESERVRALRRLLVHEFEVPRAAVSFMGYWRLGVAGS